MTTVCVGIIVTSFFGTEVSGQLSDEVRRVILKYRQGMVENMMALSEEEGKRLWPVYKEYRREATEIDRRVAVAASRFVEYQESFPNRLAEELIKELLAIETAKLHLKRRYVPKFMEQLEPKKVARLIQVEAKLNYAMAYDLTHQLPLVGY
jgi:hypothetical protein